MLRLHPFLTSFVAASFLVVGCGGSDGSTGPNPPGGAGGNTVPEAGTFVQPSVTVDGVSRPFQVFVPKAYTTDKKWPVILYIDGSGGRGTDNTSQVAQALGAIVRARASTYPAIVVFPQVPAGETTPRPLITAICLADLDWAVAKYNGDPTRLYVTGISFGGGVAYQLAYENPTKFAALAPVASVYSDASVTSNPNATDGSSYPLLAQKLKTTPTGIWHGALDQGPPVSVPQGIYNALQAAGDPARITVIPGMGHAIWDDVYVDDSFYTWLYAQHR
ncbi:MAG TPA: prolyl oligopeptidase family serine peptidase [Gemmatimonadaceae bacterium]